MPRKTEKSHLATIAYAPETFALRDVAVGKGLKGTSNRSPTDIDISISAVLEGAATGSVVAIVSGTDPDRNDRLTFSLVDDAWGAFAISDGNKLVVADSLILSTLSGDVTITVRAQDKAGATYEESFRLSVPNSSEPASAEILLSGSSIAENSLAGSEVGNLSLSDAGGSPMAGFVLVEDAGGRFALVGDALVVARSDALDYETALGHDIIVEAVAETGETVRASFRISVTDIDECPTPAAAPSHIYPALLTGNADEASARWNSGSPLGSPAMVTFAFLETVPTYYGADAAERKEFQPFGAEHRAVALDAISLVEGYTGLSFVEVAQEQAQIVFGIADLPSGSGWAYLPYAGSQLAGDVWIDTSAARDVSPGADGYKTILHELGHALGLVHPHEGTPLPEPEDNRKHTVMSYMQHPDSAGIEPSTYMPYDIAALQYLYGAGGGHGGDDVWSIGRSESFVGTIWDAGGHDTLDASAAVSRVELDLTPGAYSSVGTHYGWYPATDNVALAFGTIVEDAVGGGDNDVLLGNAVANRLDGGRGDDTLTGGGGGDVFVFKQDWGRDIVTDFEDGVDRLDFAGAGLGFADLAAAQSEAGVLISHGSASVLLAGFTLELFNEFDLAPFAVA